jgi:hypothetical protein
MFSNRIAATANGREADAAGAVTENPGLVIPLAGQPQPGLDRAVAGAAFLAGAG